MEEKNKAYVVIVMYDYLDKEDPGLMLYRAFSSKEKANECVDNMTLKDFMNLYSERTDSDKYSIVSEHHGHYPKSDTALYTVSFCVSRDGKWLPSRYTYYFGVEEIEIE